MSNHYSGGTSCFTILAAAIFYFFGIPFIILVAAKILGINIPDGLTLFICNFFIGGLGGFAILLSWLMEKHY
jgi:hypothetical protein